MKSIAFPNIFSSTKTNVIEDHEASYSNLALMLQSQKTALFGDPYFGTELQKVIFAQNNAVLRDLVVDDIYTSIAEFMPQLTVEREGIEVLSDGLDLVARIKAVNNLDHTNSLYTIKLTETGEY